MLERGFNRLRDAILAITYPQSCHICAGAVESHDDGVCCQTCWENQSITNLIDHNPFCAKCGATMPWVSKALFAAISTSGQGIPPQTFHCGSCHDLAFTCARACGEYKGALEASILFLKTHPHICKRLRQILCRAYSRHRDALHADFVMPVPLHASRERKRGFNQAAVIASFLAAEFGLSIDLRSLVRIKDTERHRAGMDAIDRRKSTEGAFKVVSPDLVRGAAVLLVDDIFTTGSTAASAARALVTAGAARINLLTIARVNRFQVALRF